MGVSHLCISAYLHCSSFSPLLPCWSFFLSPPLPPSCTSPTVCPPPSYISVCLLNSYQKASLSPFPLSSPYTPLSIRSAAPSSSAYIWSRCWAIFLNSWHVSSLGARHPPAGCLHSRSSSINYAVSSHNLHTQIYSDKHTHTPCDDLYKPIFPKLCGFLTVSWVITQLNHVLTYLYDVMFLHHCVWFQSYF